MPTNDMTQDIIYTITNPKVTFNQRLKDMAKIAENSIELVNYTELSRKYFENGAMMDMFEGKTPYRTRYCLPDYELFLKQGSELLKQAVSGFFSRFLPYPLLKLYIMYSFEKWHTAISLL